MHAAERKNVMARERLNQKNFYIRLSEALNSADGDIWAETVLRGEHAGAAVPEGVSILDTPS